MTEAQAPAKPHHRPIPIIPTDHSKLKLLKACMSRDETRRAINLLGVAGGFVMATNGNIAIRMPFSAFAGLGEHDLEEGQSYTTYKTHDGKRGFMKVDEALPFPNMQAVIDTIKPTWSFESFTGDVGFTNRQEMFYTLFKQAGHMLNPTILEDVLPPRCSVKIQGSANPLHAVIFTMGDSKIEIIAMPFKAAEKKD